jgi:WD40 repeat protein
VRSGKTYIYDVEKGLKIWLAPLLTVKGKCPQLTFRTSFLVDLYLKDQPIVGVYNSAQTISTLQPRQRNGYGYVPPLFILTIHLKLYRSFHSSYGKLHENEREPCSQAIVNLYRSALSFSPNGRFLVAGDGDGSVRIWSLRDGSQKNCLIMPATLFSITFSPDGRHIASVDFHGWLRIWDARTGQLLDTWKAHWVGFVWRSVQMGKGW